MSGRQDVTECRVALSAADAGAIARVLTARVRPHLSAARIAPAELPDCGGLRLFLLNDDFPHDALSPDELRWALNEPAYWMFCWASGLAQARQILYVSCEPSSFARDAKELVSRGWRVEDLRVLDLYPNTHHMESVALFSR